MQKRSLPAGASRSLRNFLSLNLQNKILLLVLIPLVISSTSLVIMENMARIEDTRTQLAQQRKLLIESRQQGVEDVVALAGSMVKQVAAGTADPEVAKETAKALLRNMRFDDNNYVFVFDHAGTMLVQPAVPRQEGTRMIDATDPNGKPLIRDMIDIARNGGGHYQYAWPHPGTGKQEPKYSYVANLPEWGWVIGAGVYVTEIDAAMATIEQAAQENLRATLIRFFFIASALLLTITAITVLVTRRIARQVRDTATAMEKIAHEVAEGRGDLTRRLRITSGDEIGELATQFNGFLARIQATLIEVRQSASDVYQASTEIAQSSEELASRTDQAAASLQQTSSAMEQITSTVGNNAEHAQEADRLVQSAAQVAHQGREAMEKVEKTMADISRSSTQIGDIVSMIDAIAFQTNILALNASVEAARAGDHGRGFAVVAQEVRMLAQRSADAAKQIKTLIGESVEHSRSGAEIVQQAGRTMQLIVQRVTEVTSAIAEISAGSREQSVGIGEVNTAVTQMDTMTQQNAAMVEQNSATASTMRAHAEHLNDLIRAFVLGDAANGQTAMSAPETLLPFPDAAPQHAAPLPHRRALSAG
ncbi:methyl-accepting chemotaxis protein [Thauera aromatica]|uniref:methyl-accepting chemotaxis protein n=1 Tax=Thauera aromatica TaxID=59405 RepID=UPI001FFC4B0F|nr:methyl-accepting chemotaxis protein [Thauera aromatica]MCK2088548.1 methyl-accepting chemotaxis protein [Thauera aromatica]